MSKDNVQLGYFKIGDQDSTSGIDLLCPPSKMEDVLEDTINFTIGAILRNEYCDFPITPAPKYSDTYSWICQDNSVEEEAGGTYE